MRRWLLGIASAFLALGIALVAYSPSPLAQFSPPAELSTLPHATGGGGTVVLDATNTANANSGGNVTTLSSTNQTVGSGSNRALLAGLLCNATLTSLTIKWDNTGSPQTMSLIGSEINTANNAIVYWYGLTAPTSGNKTLTASWSSPSTDCNLYSISFTGVNQTGSTSSFVFTGANGTSTTPSVSISSATNDYTVAGMVNADGSSLTAVSNTAIPNIDLTNTVINTGANYATGASIVTLTGTFNSSSAVWAIGGVNVIHN